MRRMRSYLLFLLVGLWGVASAAVWTVSPWTDDASTGIDSSKTYTVALNASYQTAPTVNGVNFPLCWGGFTGGGWNGGNGVDWDDTNNITGNSYELSRDFRYGNTAFYLDTLTPGGVYELTFLSTGWEDSGRIIPLTDKYGTFTFDQDTYGTNNGIKISGIFVADENGRFDLAMIGNFHVCAFYNAEYTGQLPVSIQPVSPAEFNGGNRVPLDSVIEWTEEFAGSLANPKFDVYMDPNSAKVEQMDPSTLVSAGQLESSYTPAGLANGAMYYWRVAAYNDVADVAPAATSKLSSFMTEYQVEPWTGAHWTDDSDSGISAGKLYTHKVNFNVSEAASTVINGVTFENDSNRTGANWNLAGALGAASGGHQVGGDGAALVSSIYYGKDPLAVLTLSGLTPGEDYVLTQFTRGWGDAGAREVRLTTSPDGLITTLDGNIEGNEIGHLFMYKYTAPETGVMSITYDPLTEDSWHHYAFSNELYQAVLAEPAPIPGAQVNYDVVFSWNVVGEVANPSYNFRIADDPNMSNIVAEQNGLATASYQPMLGIDTVYYWQIDILDGANIVYTSPMWDLVTTVPPPAEKVLEWKFDETTGAVAAQTGTATGGDGTLTDFVDAETAHVSGLVGNALKLDGTGQYVNVSAAAASMPTGAGQAFAVTGYLRTFDDFGPIFSMRNAEDGNPIIDIALGNDGVQTAPGRICMLVRDDSYIASWVNSGITVNDGRWHSLAITRYASKWTIYVDGKSVAVLNGAATGAVDLNLLGIGASPKWIMDGHVLDYTLIRDFEGLLDEFAVWNGQLQAYQIAELASLVPPTGDIDFNLSVDTTDLDLLAGDWLTDGDVPVQADAVVEDVESYNAADPNSLTSRWVNIPTDGFATMGFTVVDDPNGLYGQVVQIDYDYAGTPVHALHGNVSIEVPNRGVDLSKFDNVAVRVKRLPGCDTAKIILDFYDGRGNPDIADEDMYNKGRIIISYPDLPIGEWGVVSASIRGDADLLSCGDLYKILFSIEDGGEDVGSMLVDSIFFTDETPDCLPVVGQLVPDINGDCAVDMLDYSLLADGWLTGID